MVELLYPDPIRSDVDDVDIGRARMQLFSVDGQDCLGEVIEGIPTIGKGLGVQKINCGGDVPQSLGCQVK